MSFIIDKYADAWGGIFSVSCELESSSMRMLFWGENWKLNEDFSRSPQITVILIKLNCFLITLERIIVFHKLRIHRSNGFDLNATFMRHSIFDTMLGRSIFALVECSYIVCLTCLQRKGKECCTKCKWQLKNYFTWLSDSKLYDNKSKNLIVANKQFLIKHRQRTSKEPLLSLRSTKKKL